MVKAKTPKKPKEAVLGEIENLLGSTLEPVTPRSDYVRDLNRRLLDFPSPIPEVAVPRLPRDTVGVILGVIAGTALLILGIRVMVPLIASLMTLYGTRRKLSEEESSLM